LFRNPVGTAVASGVRQRPLVPFRSGGGRP
jgi:hypothetical protein